MNKCLRTLGIVAILLFAFNSVKAQYYYFNEVDKISVGVNLGANFASTPGLKASAGEVISGKQDPFQYDFKSKSKLGITANVNVDYNFPNGVLTLSSGLGASTKSVKIERNNGKGYDSNVKLDAYFLTLPVNLYYNIAFGANNILKLGGGPYLSYGLGGSYKTDQYSYGIFRGNQILMDRLGFGIGVSARATFSKVFQLTLGYDYGLTNMMKSTEKKIANTQYTDEIVYIDKTRFNSLYLTVGFKIF